jgi:SAM-dependent methyltransferase
VTDRYELRRAWDARHADREIESEATNSTLIAEVGELPRGTALDLACGAGTNALWLARHGWNVTGLDWSGVALAKARARADAAGVRVRWIEADLLGWRPDRAYDLVVVLYLHLAPGERGPIYRSAAEAVAPGGHLLVIAHDPAHLAAGMPGPQDPERFFSAPELGRELLAADPTLVVEKALTVHQIPPPGIGPIDALLRVRRPGTSAAVDASGGP